MKDLLENWLDDDIPAFKIEKNGVPDTVNINHEETSKSNETAVTSLRVIDNKVFMKVGDKDIELDAKNNKKYSIFLLSYIFNQHISVFTKQYSQNIMKKYLSKAIKNTSQNNNEDIDQEIKETVKQILKECADKTKQKLKEMFPESI